MTEVEMPGGERVRIVEWRGPNIRQLIGRRVRVAIFGDPAFILQGVLKGVDMPALLITRADGVTSWYFNVAMVTPDTEEEPS